MHELGVVFHLIDAVQEQAKVNSLENIDCVVIDLGEVSGVVEELLKDCWKWAVSKHENMKDCSLHVNTIKAVTYCTNCNTYYKTIAFGKECPVCKGLRTYLVQGNEFILSSIVAT